MRVLWLSSFFLHPPNRGGQVRSLQILRWLHRWHEIHYMALQCSDESEGVARSAEYSSRAYPVFHRLPRRGSPAFIGQAAANLLSALPLAIRRYSSPELRRQAVRLLEREKFDRVVCDFLDAAQYAPSLEDSLLFQHNVETTIWQRHHERAADPLRRWFFGVQARRMFSHERDVCGRAGHIVAVSEADAERMRTLFGVARVSHIPTGVELEHFAPPPEPARVADLVFVGSMDWLPNQDAVAYFVGDVLPLIRRRLPSAHLAIVGRNPSRQVLRMAERDPGVTVTGTVPDVRPYLFGSVVSVVPLHVGGGTRLKIYESMAARVPVVSTTVGAEGLSVRHQENILIADTTAEFADACVELIENPALRARIAAAAWEMVAGRYSSQAVAKCFERILTEQGPAANR